MHKHHKKYSLEQLKNKVLYYINYRIRSKKEVLTKLDSLSASEENTQLIIDELENLGLINDEKFIIFFIQDYIETKKYGITRIKSELHRKGFESWLIQDALHEYFDEDEYDPVDSAYQLIQQKYHSRQILPENHHKILAFLARRGFEYRVSTQALAKFTKKNIID